MTEGVVKGKSWEDINFRGNQCCSRICDSWVVVKVYNFMLKGWDGLIFDGLVIVVVVVRTWGVRNDGDRSSSNFSGSIGDCAEKSMARSDG